jgi:hypothetical protein
MVVADAYRQPIPEGEGKGAILKKLQGDPLHYYIRETVRERHQRAENVLLPNNLLSLPTWSMVVADAYRRYISKGEGTRAILKKLQGDPRPSLYRGDGSRGSGLTMRFSRIIF